VPLEEKPGRLEDVLVVIDDQDFAEFCVHGLVLSWIFSLYQKAESKSFPPANHSK
jgi:hypothetical protein